MATRRDLPSRFTRDEIALEAVVRGLTDLALMSKCDVLVGPFEFGRIVGAPVTKKTGKPVFVIHDHGTCQFGVGYTSNPEGLEEPSYADVCYYSDEASYRRDEIRRMTEPELHEELQHLNKLASYLPDDRPDLYESEVRFIRNLLRLRRHRRKVRDANALQVA